METEETAEVTEETPVAETTSEVTELSEETSPWADVLNVLPDVLHGQVTPLLDAHYKTHQSSIDEFTTKYAPYQPYLDNEVSPESINYGLSLAQAIEASPLEVFQALGNYLEANKIENPYLKSAAASAETPEVVSEVPEEFLNHPKFKEMESNLERMAQMLTEKQQTEEQNAATQALDEELAGLTAKYGEYDEEYVLTRAVMAPNVPLEDHVKAYVEKFAAPPTEPVRKPPVVLGGAGGVAPSNRLTTTDLSNAQTRRNTVAQMLQ